jgi:signal transduction histidine kinase
MTPIKPVSNIRSLIFRYGSAIAMVGIALCLTLFIWLFIRAFAAPLFFLAIMLSARKHGVGPALVATILSGICIDFFFINPQYQLDGNWDDFSRLVIFAIEGYILCWLIVWATKTAEETKKSRQELQALSLRQQILREEERKRIAREIHDELGQALTGLKMEIHLLDRQIKNGEYQMRSAEVSDKMGDLSEMIDTTIVSVRRIATELRPPVLDDLGLIAAIEWQTQDFQRRTGINCVLSANVDDIELDAEYTTAVFRIFQETLTNITRHAEASKIIVNFKKLNERLVLRVEDNGKGIQADLNTNGSLGILGMRERARNIGGELEVLNGAENGTIVLLNVPLV